MKKRLSLLLLVVCLALTLCACGESSSIVALNDEGDAVSMPLNLYHTSIICTKHVNN